MFAIIPEGFFQAMREHQLSTTDFAIYGALASFCGRDRTCWPSNRALLDRLGGTLSERTLYRSLERLEAIGLVSRRPRRGRSPFYHVYAYPSKGADMGDTTTHKGLTWVTGGGDTDGKQESLTPYIEENQEETQTPAALPASIDNPSCLLDELKRTKFIRRARAANDLATLRALDCLPREDTA